MTIVTKGFDSADGWTGLDEPDPARDRARAAIARADAVLAVDRPDGPLWTAPASYVSTKAAETARSAAPGA